MYERILVPTDGSVTAAAAMAQAIDLASAFDADVHVLHVIDTRLYDTSIESAVEPLREEGRDYIDDLLEMAEGTDVELATAIEVGRPAHTILEYVEDHAIDLVVMGASGKGGLPRRLMGSVTNYVVKHAQVPVHVAPTTESLDR